MSKTGYRLIALAALAGAAAAGVDAVIDYFFFYEESFATVAITDVPTFEIYIRSLIFAIFLAFGIFAARIVSSRERLSRDLHQSRQNFHLLFEALSDLLFVVDREGKILEVNEAVRSRLGWNSAELAGRAWTSLLLGEATASETMNGAALLQERAEASETSLSTREGEPLQVEVKFNSGNWDGQEASFCVCRDITARKRAEKALRESEAKYATLVENSLTGVFIHQNDRVVFANQTLADIYGYSKEELASLETWDLVHPGERSRMQDRAARRLAGEKVPSTYEVCGITRDGDMIWVNVRNVRITYRGEPAIMGNIVDITERKRAEEELKLSERERKALSLQILSAQEHERGRMAQELHEGIAQTLSVIKFFAESALEIEKTAEETGTPGAAALHTMIPKLQSAISEVRSISMALRPSTLDDLGLLPSLGGLRDECQSANPRLRIETQVDASESDVPDPLKIVIYRITQEALNNIAKHSGADQAVVSLRKNGEFLQLTVRDNGRGFNASENLSSKLPARSIGLRGMRERTQLTGGEFALRPVDPHGVEVRARWPADIVLGDDGAPEP